MNPYLVRIVAYPLLVLLLLIATPAFATCKEPKCSPPASTQKPEPSTWNGTLTSSSASNSTSSANAAGIGVGHGGSSSASFSGGSENFYVLPAPVGGSNLPAGMCARSQYAHFSIGWNFFSSANGNSHTDMECLHAILTVQRFRYEAAMKPPEPRLPPMTEAEKAELKALDARVKKLEAPKIKRKPSVKPCPTQCTPRKTT